MADKPAWRGSLGFAGIGIVGALLGSTFQHFYSLEQQRKKAFEAHQAEAYLAFLGAFDKFRMSLDAREAGDMERADELMEQYELDGSAAVRRISVFGDKRVVEAIAKWYRRETLHPCEESLNPELATWKAMRDAALGKSQEVGASDLAAVVGRCILNQ